MMMKAADKDDLLQRLFGALAADPETNLFALEPGALGFGALCRPLAGVDAALETKCNVLLNLPFPTNTLMQFALYASPDIDLLLEAYTEIRSNDQQPILRECTQKRVEFLRASTSVPLDRVSQLKLHDMQLLITVRLPATGRGPTEDEMDSANELCAQFLQTLRTIGMSTTALTESSYLRFMRTVLNHKKGASWRQSTAAAADETQFLCHQILDPDNAIDVDQKGLWLGEQTRVRLLSVKRLPEYLHFGLALRYIGDYVSGQRGLRGNTLITANVLFLDHAKERAKLETQHAWATKQVSGQLARFVPQWRLRKESLDLITTALEEGDRLVKAYLGIAVFTQAEDDSPAAMRDCERRSVDAAMNATTYFQELNIQLMPDEYFVQPLFMQLLPFAADETIQHSLQRYRTYVTRHVIPLLPILGAWRGTGTPAMTFHSRDGQLMSVSPYDSGTNFNCIIAAKSGSGKSFLANEMIQSFRAMGASVSMIDIGYSYKNLCSLLDGEYLQFDPRKKISLNPYSIVKDFSTQEGGEGEADLIFGILSSMAAPNEPLTNFQAAGVRRVQGETFKEFGNETNIDAIASRLIAEDDGRLRDIGHQLFSFTTKGDFGRYFNPPNSVDINNPFFVCELEELKGRGHLQSVVLRQLMYQIQQKMYMGDRAQKKLMIVDEAWSLLAQGDAREFITGSFRRVRKFNGSAIVITQSVNDLYANDGAIAIVENSANVYLLGQKPAAINQIQKDGRLSLGDSGYSMLKGVHTVSGEYSEIMFLTEQGTGIGRLVVSDFNKILYTTKAEEVAEIKSLQDSGVTLQDAVMRIAERRKHLGLRAA
jgi:conjugal transfer ATP-binding protein TraC